MISGAEVHLASIILLWFSLTLMFPHSWQLSYFVKVFTTTKCTDIALPSASGWSYRSTKCWVCNPNWPCCQVLKQGGSSLCPEMFSRGFPGPNLVVLSGNSLTESSTMKKKTHTFHICPVQFLRQLHRVHQESASTWLAKFLANGSL